MQLRRYYFAAFSATVRVRFQMIIIVQTPHPKLSHRDYLCVKCIFSLSKENYMSDLNRSFRAFSMGLKDRRHTLARIARKLRGPIGLIESRKKYAVHSTGLFYSAG